MNILYFLISVSTFIFALNLRSPLFYKIRGWDISLVFISSVFVLYIYTRTISSKKKLLWLGLLFQLSSLVYAIFIEARFHYIKSKVLSAPTDMLEIYGEHIFVGYSKEEEVINLVSKKGVGGVFITTRNVVEKKTEDIYRFTSELQNKSPSKKLFIATDQEGGDVSRLTPPLQQLPYISSVYKTGQLKSVSIFAELQAKGLRSVGVNVNFAPVVDLRNIPTNFKVDLHSRIWERAISENPEIVSEVGYEYSKVLLQNQVIPVLKHFPGLATIQEDTHFFTASNHEKIESIIHKDLLPFIEIPKKTNAWIMLGHVKLNDIDPENAASYSSKICKELIRGRFQLDEVLITDDFSMGPIFYHPKKVGGIAEISLNAGVDLILISYDPDLYYEVMYHLLYNSKTNLSTLKESSIRLQRYRL